MEQTAILKIVWRNPRPPYRRHRWEQIEQDSRSAHYLIREQVSTSAGPLWRITSNLEFVSGGRVAYTTRWCTEHQAHLGQCERAEIGFGFSGRTADRAVNRRPMPSSRISSLAAHPTQKVFTAPGPRHTLGTDQDARTLRHWCESLAYGSVED
jgi:hypothetical protein